MKLRDEQHPGVPEPLAANSRGETALSCIQGVNWRTGWMELANRPLLIDLIPGALERQAARQEIAQGGALGFHLGTAI